MNVHIFIVCQVYVWAISQELGAIYNDFHVAIYTVAVVHKTDVSCPATIRARLLVSSASRSFIKEWLWRLLLRNHNGPALALIHLGSSPLSSSASLLRTPPGKKSQNFIDMTPDPWWNLKLYFSDCRNFDRVSPWFTEEEDLCNFFSCLCPLMAHI